MMSSEDVRKKGHRSPEQALKDLLEQCHAVELKTNNHVKWKLPDGRIFVMSRTPSDWRAAHKRLSMLKRMLKESNG